jgi:2-methylcitrate dehydratase PrpD
MEIIFDGGPLNGQVADLSDDSPDLLFEFYTVTREFLIDNAGNAFAESNKKPVKHKHTYVIDGERANYQGRQVIITKDKSHKLSD